MASLVPNPALDAETKFPSILAALIIGCFLSTTSVSMRLYTRLVILHSTGFDDWMILVAQILTIGAGVAIGLETYFGMGRHVWAIPATHIVPYFQCLYASILIYNAALTFVKISILLQYRRIFTIPSMQRATMIMLTIVIAWGFTVIMMLSMICVPIQALWDKSRPGHCLPLIPAYYAPAAINIATDFATWILPLPIIRSLQLPRRQKIILMFIFGLGFFTCITSLVRLSTLKTATHTEDPTWDNTGAATWSYVELSMATLAACLPTLRPLAIRFLPRFMAGSQRANSNGAYPNTNGYLRQGPGGSKAWVSAKLGITTIGGTGGSRKKVSDTQSTETLTGEEEYRLNNINERLGANTISVERGYTVKTSRPEENNN